MPTKISNIADIAKFYAANPTAPPTNSGRTMAGAEGNSGQGQGPIYSTVNSINADGTLALLARTDNNFSVVRLSDGAFLGTLPISAANPIYAALNPRWCRDGKPLEIIWCGHDWNEIRRQTWNQPSTQQTVTVAPAGRVFIDNGQEGDLSDDGRYMAVKTAPAGGYVGGHWQDVKVGVVDIIGKKVLPGMVAGNPNACDISPDGKWLAYTDHEGSAAAEPNKLYLIADLAAGVVKPVPVDSAITNATKSIGHHGWCRTAAGVQVMVYQDNRDDLFKAFDPLTGKSTPILSYLEMFGQWKGAQHIGRTAPNGWFLLSTYECGPLPDGKLHPWANSIVMVELATKRGVVVCPTRTARNGYFTEAPTTTDGKRVFWGGNDAGQDNLELWAETIPALTGGTVPPTTTPPTPDPAPAPQTFSWPAFVDGKPVTVTMTFK